MISEVFYPELFVFLIAILSLLIGIFYSKNVKNISRLGAIALLLPLVQCFEWITSNYSINYQDIYSVSKYVSSVKIIIIASTSLLMLMMSSFLSDEDERYELPVLVLLSSLGAIVMASANNFLIFYLSLELQSLSFYVLAASNRDNLRSTEAGIKYFVLGSIASGIILYGISLIYAFTGTINFSVLLEVYNNEMINIFNLPVALLIGIILLAIGMFFKVAVVPFHMWLPDVYEGSPTIFTALFASFPKFAMFAFMVRFFDYTVTKWQHYLSKMFIIVGIISIIIGALGAIRQSNLKRLLAYSSIGHVGFMMLGFIVVGRTGLYATFLYMILYLLMSIGIFAIILYMEKKYNKDLNLTDLLGLSHNYKFLAIFIAIYMFSMAGIPPFAGFFAKFEVIRALVSENMVPVAIVAVLGSVISAFYYLNVVKVMYFDSWKPSSNITCSRCSIMDSNLIIGAILALFNLCYMIYGQQIYAIVKSLVYVQ